MSDATPDPSVERARCGRLRLPVRAARLARSAPTAWSHSGRHDAPSSKDGAANVWAAARLRDRRCSGQAAASDPNAALRNAHVVGPRKTPVPAARRLTRATERR
jgi:hypothetical protein